MSSEVPILRVAVPAPLRKVFDYLPPRHVPRQQLVPGQRLRVPFGRRSRVGVLLALADESDVDRRRLKAVEEVLDGEALLPPDVLSLLSWASEYYHHPLGEVLFGALPTLLRRGRPAEVAGEKCWRLAAPDIDADLLARAPRQACIHELLRRHPGGLTAGELDRELERWREPMARLVARGLVAVEQALCLPETGGTGEEGRGEAVELSEAQAQAVAEVRDALDRYAGFVLDGVTGSGKTEVYLGIIDAVLAQGRQALVLVPEINLTPQTLRRFRRRFAAPVVALHSGLAERDRLAAWNLARSGAAAVVIGTRSAVFTPLARPGVIIVDEEHDSSLKQQDGFRYHARDVAVKRASDAAIPVVLGSATPSLESLYNVQAGRYRRLHLPQRVGGAQEPDIHILDVRRQPMEEGLSLSLLTVMQRHLEAGGQVLLFLNRRGFAPVLLCHECGWVASCQRCDARMTLHQGRGRLVCHHCGHERPINPSCPECGTEPLYPVGLGTERVEEVLKRRFPDLGLARVDRDSTRRKGAMEAVLSGVHSGEVRILVGTQMLAKGHHFPGVTLVGVLDVDHGLFSTDFRASERMAQLILQVAGRAGRAERPGEVYVQTHHPEHPLLYHLVQQGYDSFAREALEERQGAALPPYTSLALLRAEAPAREAPLAFLSEARREALQLAGGEVTVIGPVPSPMERRAGRYRAQLLLQATARPALHRLLRVLLSALESADSARRVRWSIDVDPVDMY